VSIEIRGPVYLRYAKSRKRFILCGQRMAEDRLHQHMRGEHGIESHDLLRFYRDRSKDDAWWREHR
jgi:hypothetical protein